jgi:hypothetical protein
MKKKWITHNITVETFLKRPVRRPIKRPNSIWRGYRGVCETLGGLKGRWDPDDSGGACGAPSHPAWIEKFKLGRFIPPQETLETLMVGKITNSHFHQCLREWKNLGVRIALLNTRLVEWTKECFFIIVLSIVSLIFFCTCHESPLSPHGIQNLRELIVFYSVAYIVFHPFSGRYSPLQNLSLVTIMEQFSEKFSTGWLLFSSPRILHPSPFVVDLELSFYQTSFFILSSKEASHIKKLKISTTIQNNVFKYVCSASFKFSRINIFFCYQLDLVL